MPRHRGLSVRFRLTLSYAGFLVLAGGLLLAVVWAFLLRYVPDGPIYSDDGFIPNRTDLLRAFAPAAALVLLFLLVIGLAGGWFLAGRMLAPLGQLTDAARLASTGSLSHRIRLAGKGDEFRELADAFDHMLEQLEAQAAAQQRFAANASHELRTPLAITQTLLDVAQQDPARDIDALIARLQGVNTRAIELADALLLLKRSGDAVGAHTTEDLSLIAEEAAENLLPLAERRGITLKVTGGAAHVLGSQTMLLQMVTNLVHNAIVHNLDRDGWVVVETAHERGAAVIRVSNSGRPTEPAEITGLVEPFRRGAGRARGSDDHAGAGLGLAIVHNIVFAHRGTLTMEPPAAGGMVVSVHLPAA